jgi:hypothetical protein
MDDEGGHDSASAVSPKQSSVKRPKFEPGHRRVVPQSMD